MHKYNVLKFKKWECIINLYSTLLLQMEIKIILSRLLQTFLISLPRDYQEGQCKVHSRAYKLYIAITSGPDRIHFLCMPASCTCINYEIKLSV